MLTELHFVKIEISAKLILSLARPREIRLLARLPLVRFHRCLELLLLNQCHLLFLRGYFRFFLLRRRHDTPVPVHLAFLVFGRTCLYGGNSLHVILIVETVAQNVAEFPERAFQSVCSGFFLALFERVSLTFGILHHSVANILTTRK